MEIVTQGQLPAVEYISTALLFCDTMRHGRISQRRGKTTRESSDARRSAAGFDGAHHHRVQQGTSGGRGFARRVPGAARHDAVGHRGDFADGLQLFPLARLLDLEKSLPEQIRKSREPAKIFAAPAYG